MRTTAGGAGNDEKDGTGIEQWNGSECSLG